MALSRIPSSQFTVNSNINIPTGKKLSGVDSGSVYAPGSIIQTVVNTFTTKVMTSTGNTWFDTGFYVNITPKYSNSKIWLNITTAASWAPGVSLCVVDIRRFSGSTQQAVSPHTGTMNLDGGTLGAYGGSGGSADNGVPLTVEWFDSPSTTSAITYRLYYRGNGNGATAIGSIAHSNSSTYDIITTLKATEIAQ